MTSTDRTAHAEIVTKDSARSVGDIVTRLTDLISKQDSNSLPSSTRPPKHERSASNSGPPRWSSSAAPSPAPRSWTRPLLLRSIFH
jgi:hypothetical protein